MHTWLPSYFTGAPLNFFFFRSSFFPFCCWQRPRPVLHSRWLLIKLTFRGVRQFSLAEMLKKLHLHGVLRCMWRYCGLQKAERDKCSIISKLCVHFRARRIFHTWAIFAEMLIWASATSNHLSMLTIGDSRCDWVQFWSPVTQHPPQTVAWRGFTSELELLRFHND